MPPLIRFGASLSSTQPLPKPEGRMGVVSFPKTHPLVPQPPFLWNIVGPTGVGKTTALIKALLTAYKYLFDEIYYFVPTMYNDPGWALIEANPDRVFTDWDDATLERLHQRINERAREARERDQSPPAALLVLDDSTGLQKVTGRLGPLDKIYALDRKNNLSVVNLAQKYRGQLSSLIRSNATHTSIFRIPTEYEIKAIVDDLRPVDIPHEQFMSMYHTAVNAGLGSFLHISRFSPSGHRFSVGFDRVFAQ